MMNTKSRPISPHITIYKPQITSVLSILHRISGVLLYAGLLLLAWIVISAAFIDVIFAQGFLDVAVTLFSSVVGKCLLFIWILALNYHAVNGIRHLAWDMGVGLSKEAVTRSGIISIICALVFTAISWTLIFKVIFSYV
ncbi:MAG: succinate dehydrogenase, cytochrome b556 subunit [Rickettsiales bacterium]|nr:succinate dehydrogenase, cytochrome b556 subunit [Rickettsiales bacterium]